MDAGLITSMLFATVVAGTPLIIVALGLLVSEKAGVLNLGAEGMMAMGAVAAFAVTHHSGSTSWTCRSKGRNSRCQSITYPLEISG